MQLRGYHGLNPCAGGLGPAWVRRPRFPLEGPGLAWVRGARARCGDLESGSGRQSADGVVGSERVIMCWWCCTSLVLRYRLDPLRLRILAGWSSPRCGCIPRPHPGLGETNAPWWPRLHPGFKPRVHGGDPWSLLMTSLPPAHHRATGGSCWLPPSGKIDLD